MIVVGFDNREHKFNYVKNRSRKNRSGKSSLHSEAVSILKRLMPLEEIYEEVTLPGSKKPGRNNLLYADILIPRLMVVIEAHGRQHFEFVPHFHKSRMDFIKGKNRDRDKIEWCEINNFRILELSYKDKKKWETMITQFLKD